MTRTARQKRIRKAMVEGKKLQLANGCPHSGQTALRDTARRNTSGTQGISQPPSTEAILLQVWRMAHHNERGTEMTGYNHDGARRNNEELKAKCNRVIEARRELLKEASRVLGQLRDRMDGLMLDADDAMYNAARDAVWTAAYRVEQEAKFMDRDANDTYLGNAASGMLGEYIEKFGLPEEV